MKKFQQNLFVVLAVALCSLCAYQWLQQSQQRNAIDTLLYDRSLDIFKSMSVIRNVDIAPQQNILFDQDLLRG